MIFDAPERYGTNEMVKPLDLNNLKVKKVFSQEPPHFGCSTEFLNSASVIMSKKCPYSEGFWSAFSRIWAEYGEILRISPFSVRVRENADQNNSEYGDFSRSVIMT